MYGFPPVAKIKRLKGLELIEIGYKSNQTVLYFGVNSNMVCDKEFLLTDKNGKESIINVPTNDTVLFKLLDDEIEDVKIVDNNTMVLLFSSGNKLTFVDDKIYDSYYIVIFGKKFLV